MKYERKIWMLGGTLTAGVVAYVFLVFLPLGAKIQGLQDEARQKLELVTGVGPLAPALHDTEQRIHKASQYIDDWREAGSALREPSALYAQIHQLAQKAGVSTTRFNPGSNIDHAWLRETSLSIGLSGSFAEIHDFVARLESLPLALWVDSLQIEPNGGNSDEVRCEISLVVFSDNSGNSG